MAKPIYHKAPWTDELTSLIKADSPFVKLGMFQQSPGVDCRILAEGNFQFAKHCVNMYGELVSALKDARDALNGAPNTVGLHNQIDVVLEQAEEFK